MFPCRRVERSSRLSPNRSNRGHGPKRASVLWAIALALPVAALSTTPAHACTQRPPPGWRPPTPEEAFYHATLVLHVRALGDTTPADSAPVKLQVLQRLKGEWWSVPLAFTTSSASMCGFGEVKSGREYVFFFYDGWRVRRELPSWNQPEGTPEDILAALAPSPGAWQGPVSPEGLETQLRLQVHARMNHFETTDPTNPHPDRTEVVDKFWMRVGMHYLEVTDPTNPHPQSFLPPFGRLPRKPPGWFLPEPTWPTTTR